jgi:peroxiredoxin
MGRAPDFELQTLDGQTVRLADFDGKVLLIDFWATWCGPCRKQIPHLKSLYTELGPLGFEILGVAVGDREDSVRRFVEQIAIDYTTCMGTNQIVTDFGNFSSIPTAFLVDRDGNIAARYVGLQDKGTLERAIRRLLGDGV